MSKKLTILSVIFLSLVAVSLYAADGDTMSGERKWARENVLVRVSGQPRKNKEPESFSIQSNLSQGGTFALKDINLNIGNGKNHD